MSACLAGKTLSIALLVILSIVLAASIQKSDADCERNSWFSLVVPIFDPRKLIFLLLSIKIFVYKKTLQSEH